MFLFLASDIFAREITIAWNANTEPYLGGYWLYYGTASRTYTSKVDVGNQTYFTLFDLVDTENYYFAVTAYDVSRNFESSFSNEVSTKATTIGVFRKGVWYLDTNGNGLWETCQQSGGADFCVSFGQAGDVPVVGDWNGDGRTEIGVKRGNLWYLDYDGSGTWNAGDRTYNFGLTSDQPVAGDWNGDGRTEIGVKRGNLWYLDYDGSGTWNAGDRTYNFGLTSDQPVAGDWNGDGRTEIGVKRGNLWYLDYDGSGTWNASDRTYNFGLASDQPVVGDRNGDGKTKIGVFRNGSWYLDANGNGRWENCQQSGGADFCFSFGQAGDVPVTGRW